MRNAKDRRDPDLQTVPAPGKRPKEELDSPPTVGAMNVCFDLTPQYLVTSYITDRGVYEPRRIGRLAMP